MTGQPTLSDAISQAIEQRVPKRVAAELAEELDRSVDWAQKRISACRRRRNGERFTVDELDVVLTMARRERHRAILERLEGRYLRTIDFTSAGDRQARTVACLERLQGQLENVLSDIHEIQERSEVLGEEEL